MLRCNIQIMTLIGGLKRKKIIVSDDSRDRVRTITIEGARITLRNFKGKEGPYNQEGRRNFCVILTDELANKMIDDEWNVRYLKPKEEGDEPTPIIQVIARFDIRPPRVVLLTDTTRTQLDEKSIEVLDYANIKNIDLIARQHYWNMGSRSGYNAYLQTMFVTIEEDELEKKYQVYEDPPEDPFWDWKTHRMEFTTFVRRPYTIQAVEITRENIAEVAKYIGELHEKSDGSPYILVNERLVPNVNKVYLGFYMTRMGSNIHCYSRYHFNERFMEEDEDTKPWIEMAKKSRQRSWDRRW